MRVQKTVGSASTVYIRSGSRVIAEYDNGAAVGSPSREFIWADPLPGSALVAGIFAGTPPTTVYYYSDHLSARGEMNSSGTPIGEQGHFPFGESWYSHNSTTGEWVFTSYQRDQESGLDYAMARYYDGSAGRFCSVDTVGGRPGDPQSWNRYAYVENDPIDRTDPSGQNFIDSLLNVLGKVMNWLSQIGAGSIFQPVATGSSGDDPFSEDSPLLHSIGPDALSGPLVIQNFAASTGEEAFASGPFSSYSPCSHTKTEGSREVRLVSRSIGGPDGDLSPEQHTGLVFNAGTDAQPDHYIAQAGPTPTGGLSGQVSQASAGWWQTFRMAQGANWDKPTESVPVPVTTVDTFYVAADQSTAPSLNSLKDSVNSSFQGSKYDYKNGPNSNSWIHRFIDKLCGLGFFHLPIGSPTIRGW